MSRAGWLLLVIAVAAGGAVAAVPRVPARDAAAVALGALPADDPFPIRRVRGDASQLPDLLKQLEAGPVVRLPRAEFESRVRAAGRAAAAAKLSARVADATYSAELEAGELTGAAEFGILNAHGVTGFVPLDPLRLAVRSAKWSDGGEAVLAVPPGAASPAVWVDRPGRRVLQLGWSLAGTSEPGERRFELRGPACPASVLELSLPADEMPVPAADVLLTGPFPAPGKPGRRLWRLRFGGRAKVEFAVRAAGAPGGVARATLAARYELSPGQLAASFEYDLHPAHGTAGEWSFLADPGLRVTDVVTNNRAGWSVDPPARPDGPRRVRVGLRQPGPGGKVLISAVAPFPDAARPGDALPAVRPLNAVMEGESLEVRVAPPLKVEWWAAGDYRLLGAADAPPPLPGGEPVRVLSLVGTLLPPGSDEPFRRMPSVRAAPAGADFATRERLEWTFGPARASLVARVGVRVRRGPLFQLAVRPPPGYVLDRRACGPEELVSHVRPPANGTQVVEFARPLAGGQQAELHLEFRGPAVRPGEALAFPAFAAAGAAERGGWLSVAAAPQWRLATRPGAGARRGGLWGWLTADAPPEAQALYLFRGKEPDGTATPAPAKPAVAADAVVRVDAAGGKWLATTRFALDVTGGEVPALVALVAGPPGDRAWKLPGAANSVVEAVPVPAEFLRLGEGRTAWVLRLARPLAGKAVLETTATGPAAGAPAALPVPRLFGAAQATRAEVAPGLRGRAEASVEGDSVGVRPGGRGAGPLPVSDAYLVTAVRGPDDVLAAFGGTVRDSRGGSLRVFLPGGAEVSGVCVAGRWLNPACCGGRDESGALPVPVPAGAAVRFEVRYRLPVAPGWPLRRVHSPAPTAGEGSPFLVARWWAFAAGSLPAWPAGAWGASGDEPPLLGGTLAGAEPLARVVRSDGDRARVGSARVADALAVSLGAAVLAVGLLALARRSARGAVLLAVAVGASLVAAEFGPPWWVRVGWPPFLAATGALAAVLVALAAGVTGGARRPLALAAAASLAFLALRSLAASAQPPAPATVLVLAGPGGAEEVVAPRALLARLDAVARPAPPAAVVTAAEYDLRADGSGARVVARFAVFSFRAGGDSVTLPLGDARLERVAVDGRPAFPAAARPDAYSVALPGRGRHEVEVRFAAAVGAAGTEREVRFGVPEVPQARLVAALPGAARQPQAVGRLGREVAPAGGGRAALEADLGGARAVHLRWREGAGGAAAVKVREGCVWDVAESGAELTAAYLVRVEQGTLPGLRFDVPRELEVLRVAARSLDAPAAPLPLRDWALAAEKGDRRLLRVDFQNPAAGRLLVVLRCAPRRPLTRQPVLRFPRVHFGGLTGEAEAVYGLRASRVAVETVGLGGVIDFAPDAFKDFAAVPDLRLDPLGAVRAFRPAPGGAAELRPVLRVGEPASTHTLTAWQVGPHRADAAGTVAWGAKEAPPLVEFDVPGVKVLEVRGADVAAWSQSGSRVQAWLRPGAREGALEWTGTLALAPAGKPPGSLSFDPPHPRVQHARPTSEEVRVRPVVGWSAKADRSRGWQALPAPPGELRFRTELPAAPPLRVQLSSR